MKFPWLVLLLALLLPPAAIIHASETLTIRIFDEEQGNAMRYVGYNQGHFLPGSNTSAWLAYSGVNALRFWASVDVYVQTEDIDTRDGVETFEEFERRRAELRQDPEGRRHIQWPAIQDRFENLVYPGSNRYVVNFVLEEMQSLSIAPIAQMHSTRWGETWQDHWTQWQRFYAVAYHLARAGEVEHFMMFNEPDHPHSGGYSADEYLTFLRIASDAIRSAVADVNAAHGQTLSANLLAPVTAGLPTSEWGKKPLASLRTGLDNHPIDHNLFNVFANHRYGPTWERYAREIDETKAMMRKHSPNRDILPIMYTEWGRYTTARWHKTDDTLDTPYVARDIAAIYGAAMERDVLGMIAFKFSNTSRKQYPNGMKSGHHSVREEGDWDITGSRRTSEVVRLFAKGFAGERSLRRVEIDQEDRTHIQAWASVDSGRNTLFLWCVNLKDDDAVTASLDLSLLPIADGSFAIVEQVEANAFGEVADIIRVPKSRHIQLDLPKQSATLLSLALGEAPAHRRLKAGYVTNISLRSGDPHVQLPVSSPSVARTPSNAEGDTGVLLRFQGLPENIGDIRSALLRIHGESGKNETGNVIQAWVLPDLTWRANTPSGRQLTEILSKPGYVGGKSRNAFPVGHLTFAREPGYRTVDIGPLLNRAMDGSISILLVAPLRQPEDPDDAAVSVSISPLTSTYPPTLDLLLEQPKDSKTNQP